MIILQTVRMWPPLYVLVAAASPSLVTASMVVSGFVARAATGNARHGLFEWTRTGLEPKATYLAAYGLILATAWMLAMFVLVARTSAGFRSRYVERRGVPGANEAALIGGLLGLTSVMLLASGRNYPALAVLGLASVFLAVSAALTWWTATTRRPARYRLPAMIAAVIGAVPLVFALALTPFHVPNEFLALPETTILSTGKHIDNLDFINSKQLEGLYIPDRRKADQIPRRFVLKLDVRALEADPTLEAMVGAEPDRFFLHRDRALLEIHGPIEPADYTFLSPLIDGNAERERFLSRIAEDVKFAAYLGTRRYTAEELEFLELNRPELERQLVLGRYFYHHAYLFLPALEGVLQGAVTSASQYGKGFTEFLVAVLDRVPQSSYFNAYLLLLYASYALYFGMILGVAYAVGMRGWRLFLIGLVTLIAYLVADIETTRLGVGLAPWRHIFDVVVLWLLYRDCRAPSLWSGVLLAALAAFSIYWSRETGLFLTVAVVASLIMRGTLLRRPLDFGWASLSAGLASAAWWLGNPRTQVSAVATLFGVNTPELPAGFVQLLVAAVLMAALVWWYLRTTDTTEAEGGFADWMLVGATLVYVAASGIYLLWYPRPHHLVPVIPVIGLALVAAYRVYVRRPWVHVPHVGPVTVVLVSLVVGALGVLRIAEVVGEQKIFRSHVNYRWDFPYGHVVSTGDPQLLDSAIRLLRKYEPGAAVNILSPWEVVLLPFAGKAKSGPFLVTYDSLLSKKEVQEVVRGFLSSDSPNLFVDTKITEGDYEWALAKGSHLETDRGYASYARIRAHTWLRPVFEMVRPCYELVERGEIISVYRRKASVSTRAASSPAWSSPDC